MSEVPEETGDERVDAVLAGLGDLAGRPVGEHVAVFDEAFSGLEAALGAVDGQVDGQVNGQVDGRTGDR
ncbi:hypothetical protein AB0L53_17870 [Nonomuraea sp. NPDC052129]|uniref:hypothetical protein n=1 Tax=unclassified Nonomuraea TaxID=2593643 RepID=UPI0033CEF9CC